jgi:uncharacterized protein YjbJ (UPF0337 family)
MKTNIPLIAAIAGAVGVVAYVLYNTPGPQHSTGLDAVEDAARGTAQWGSKNRIFGSAGNIVGKVKEGFGQITGDPNLADEGAGEQVEGTLKNAAGAVAQAAGQTIHDLNR